jgi:hypothetical protein
MNWYNYFPGSNNTHTDMPALMADGRLWSSWQPEAVINSQIQKDANIKSNWEYRQYIQNNAEAIMNFNTNESIYESGNNPYTLVNNQVLSNTPFLYKSYQQNGKPIYGYCDSDLKRSYLTREQLNARMIAPSINSNLF